MPLTRRRVRSYHNNAAAGGWTTPKGFNFRATAGFVTDGANEIAVLGTEIYPTVATIGGQSVTYGWDASIAAGAKDRNATNDRRLAGTIVTAFGVVRVFHVTLPAAGNYSIRAAFGDSNGPQAQTYAVKDGSTTLISKTNATPTKQFFDAAGADLLTSAWPGSNAAVSVGFAGTELTVVCGDAVSARALIAHLQITQL